MAAPEVSTRYPREMRRHTSACLSDSLKPIQSVEWLPAWTQLGVSACLTGELACYLPVMAGNSNISFLAKVNSAAYTDNLCRNACNNSIGGDIPGDHCAGADNCSFTNSYTIQYHCARSDPHMVPYNDGPF